MRNMTRRSLAGSAIGSLFLCLIATQASYALTTCTFTTVGTTMTLDADCTTDTTILIPDGYTLDGNGFMITAVDPSGGHFKGAVVTNAGGIAHVEHLTVNASGLADVCDGGADRLRGIMFEGASGSIRGNTVTDINQGVSGCQEGNGIEVRNAPFDGTHPGTKTVEILNNVVSRYQKNGITANGDVYTDIRNNVVFGIPPTPTIAQNGIQFGYGATGQAKGNTVNSNWYTGASWTSSGILIFEANSVMVEGNQVVASQSGIVMESWCYQAPTADDNHIVRNTITGSEWGVIVDAYSYYSSCNASSSRNKVTNNTISALNGDIGVFVGTAVIGGTYTPVASNNKIINNKIDGFTTALDTTGTNSKVHANRPSHP